MRNSNVSSVVGIKGNAKHRFYCDGSLNDGFEGNLSIDFGVFLLYLRTN
jgi:hypothetical protein